MLEQFKRLLGHLYGCLHDTGVISLKVNADGSVWLERQDGRPQRWPQTLDRRTRQGIVDLVQDEAFDVNEALMFEETLSFLNHAHFLGFYAARTHQPAFQISWATSYE